MAAFMSIPFASLMQPSSAGGVSIASAGSAIRLVLEDDSRSSARPMRLAERRSTLCP
jgi:hypothetical protein